MKFQIKLPVVDARGRTSWKLERQPHGSKEPLEFESDGVLRRWLRKRPWIEKFRKIPV